MNQHLCTVLLIIAVTSNCGDLVSAVGCDELDYNTDYTEDCKGSSVTFAYCPPGKRLTDPCEGSCDYCPTGQYQNSYNTCETCRNCTTRADCDKCDGHVLIGQCSSKTNAKCGCPICPTCETCPTPPEGNIPPTQEDTTPVVSCPPVEPCPPVVPCPPVEPCPSVSPQPDKESLGSCNDSVHKWWRIWGILAIIIFLLLLLGFLIHLGYCKWQSGQQEGYEGIPTNGQEMYPPNNVATQPEGSGLGPSPPQGAEGGDPSPVATPPEGSGLGPSPPQGAEGGDPSPGSQWQFSNAAMGEEVVSEPELANLVSPITDSFVIMESSDVQLFCSQIGIPESVYNPEFEDSKLTPVEILHYVFVRWSGGDDPPLTRNRLCQALLNFDEQNGTSLCQKFVDIANHEKNSLEKLCNALKEAQAAMKRK